METGKFEKRKTIIALWHKSNKGKTETLRALGNLLLDKYPGHRAMHPDPANVPVESDFRLVVQISGIVVAIESKGDPNTNLEGRLRELTTIYKADIIFCSTRTKRDTVYAVDNVAGQVYQKIWTSTYDFVPAPDPPNTPAEIAAAASAYALLNRQKAKHLLDLAVASGLLPAPAP